MALTRTLSAKDLIKTRSFQVILGIGLMFATSQASIPLNPVPINLATIGALLIGLTYTPRHALESFFGWILLGAAGLPVFANFSGGAHILVGPTAGYIFGMAAAGIAVAALRQKLGRPSFWTLLSLGAFGQVIIFLSGIGWLSTFLGLEGALIHGLYPFILPGCLKVGILVAALRLIQGTPSE